MPRRTYPRVAVPKQHGQTPNQLFEAFMQACCSAKRYYPKDKNSRNRWVRNQVNPAMALWVVANKEWLKHEDATPTNLKHLLARTCASPKRVRRA